MSLTQSLTEFNDSVLQCERLIVNAHRQDANNQSLLPARDQQQITVAAFLNLYIAWETFLEAAFSKYMTKVPTIGGQQPVKYVSPPSVAMALSMIVGPMRHFDYANHTYVRKIAPLYFSNGYPFEPHLGAMVSDLDDMRVMRNASAHISSTTQTALEGLAIRIFGAPRPGISLYTFLTSVDPRAPPATVFSTYKDKLSAAAALIANG